MPPKQKTPFEKYVQERKQLRRSLNSIFNEASSHFAKTTLTDDEIALVKGSLDLLYTTFEELHTLERELRVIALEEIKDETEQNEFLDEGDAVVIQNKGKLTKLELFFSKLENVVRVGDVVLIADDDMPRHRWELGVVEKLLTGADHLCRSVAIRTSKGHTTRSLVKLYQVELNAVDCFKDANKGIDLQLAPDEDTQATRVPRTAAITARDAIVAQLIDSDQD